MATKMQYDEPLFIKDNIYKKFNNNNKVNHIWYGRILLIHQKLKVERRKNHDLNQVVADKVYRVDSLLN